MAGIQLEAEFTGKDTGLAATVSKVEGELGRIEAANKRSADSAGTHATKMSTAHDQIGGAVTKSAGQAQDASGRFVGAQKEMGTSAGEAAGQTEGAGERISGAQRKMGDSADQSAERFKSWATAAAAAALAAEGALAKSAVSSAANMETSYAHMKGLVGVNDADLAALRQQAVQVGHDTGVGAQAAANAQYFLTSAGLTTAQSMEATTIAAKAQAAGLGTMSQVADASSSVMNAYAKSGMTAAKATDIMVASVKFGKMEAASLGQEIGQVIPIASNMGISFDQVGAAVAGMSLTGMTAGEAVTGLRAAIQAMMTPTSAGEKILRQYGLSGDELRKTIREKGLLAGMQELRGAFRGHDEDLKPALHSVEAFNGVLALTGDNAGQIASIFDGVANSTGSLDTAFNAVKDTMQFKMNQASADLKQGLTNLGQAITPLAATAVGAFGDMAKYLGEIPGPAAAAVGAVTGLATAALGASKLVSTIGPGLVAAFEGGALLGPIALGAAAGVGVLAAVWMRHEQAVKEQAGRVEAVTAAMQKQGGPAVELGHHMEDLAKQVGMFNDAAKPTPQIIDGLDTGLVIKDLGDTGVAALGKLGVTTDEYFQAVATGSDVFHNFAIANKHQADTMITGSDAASVLTRKMIDNTEAGSKNEKQTIRLLDIAQHWAKAQVSAKKNQDDLTASTARQALLAAQKKPELAGVVAEAGVKLNIDTSKIGKLSNADAIRLAERFKLDIPLSTNLVEAGLARFQGQEQAAGESAGDLNDRLAAQAAAADQLKGAIEEVDNAMDHWLGNTLTRDESQIKWIENTDKLTESFAKNGASMDLHTEAGRKNIGVANDLVRSVRDMLKANNDAGGSEETATAIRNNAAQSFRDQAVAAGVSKDKIDEYVAIIMGLPSVTGASITATNNQATATTSVGTAADTTKGKVQGLDGTTATVHVNGDDSNAQTAIIRSNTAMDLLNGKTANVYVDAHARWVETGGIATDALNTGLGNFAPTRAGGGPMRAGVPYWVGEEGPELVIPKMDGVVIPADASAAIAAGPGGGGGVGGGMTINVAPVMGMSATATGQAAAAALLNEVRRQGGLLTNVPSRAF